MTDQQVEPSPADGRPTPPPRPTWVKSLMLVAALIVVVLLILKLSGSDHGPGRHATAGHHADRRSLVSI